MNGIFSAVFEAVWKRKETKIFLVFALYPLIYFVASFFGSSNFMQINIANLRTATNIDLHEIGRAKEGCNKVDQGIEGED